MIQSFDKKRPDILEYFLGRFSKENSTFYYTADNRRVFVKTKVQIKALLKDCKQVYVGINEKDDIDGVIVVWRGMSNGFERYYVKVAAIDKNTVMNLLTVLLWNTNKELFVKLHKNSDLIKVFNGKGFRFFHGRGDELLMRRPQYVGSNFNVSGVKDKESDR